MNKTTPTLLLMLLAQLLLSQTKQLVTDDGTRVALTYVNNDIENARRLSVSIGLAFVDVQYYNYTKFVVGVSASAYGGLQAGYSHCFKNSSKIKPELYYLGRKTGPTGYPTYFYAKDSVIVNKMHCVQGGIIAAPLLLDAGVFVRSVGFKFGYRRFRAMVNEYTTKSKTFSDNIEKTFRKNIGIDLLYFPSFTYDDIQNNGPTIITTEKNVLGVMVSYNGNAIRKRAPAKHQKGIAWRLGAGYTSNTHFFMDIGYGFSF